MLVVILVALLAIFWRVSIPPRPDPRMVALAARATLYAMPTTTPQRIVVTQIVVVTATPTPAMTATVTPTATPAVAPSVTAPAAPDPAIDAQTPETGAQVAFQPATGELTVDAVAAPAIVAEETRPGEVVAADASAAEPVAGAAAFQPASSGCPGASANQYTTIPVAGGWLEHPAEQHADLNLGVRGYQPVSAEPVLVEKNGPVDDDPPQLAGLFASAPMPQFGQAYQVYDWDWGCAEHGCRAAPVEQPAVTLIALYAPPGETVRIPRRGQQIFEGGFKALVLYAEATRITLGYTRDDSVAGGYVVQIEHVCVDPNLLAVYQNSAVSGRGSLPALREEEALGVVDGGELLIAVRDRGAYLDPRSRLDWWHGY